MSALSTTSDETITIIDTGIANTASVDAAFKRLGYRVKLTCDIDTVRNAALVVLPGVGNFRAGMQALRTSKLDQIVIERVQNNRPLLGICLGLQLLCVSSQESPGVDGLGIIESQVTRFPKAIRTPQHGWNKVGQTYAYFSNTFRIETIPDQWSGQLADHGGPFVAYLQRGTTLACQFHPELSGTWGSKVLNNWIQFAKEAQQC